MEEWGSGRTLNAWSVQQQQGGATEKVLVDEQHKQISISKRPLWCRWGGRVGLKQIDKHIIVQRREWDWFLQSLRFQWRSQERNNSFISPIVFQFLYGKRLNKNVKSHFYVLRAQLSLFCTVITASRVASLLSPSFKLQFNLMQIYLCVHSYSVWESKPDHKHQGKCPWSCVLERSTHHIRARLWGNLKVRRREE